MAFANGTAPVESKSAKKRKAKVEAGAAASSEGSTTPIGDKAQASGSTSEQLPSGVDRPSESSYLKELNKYARSWMVPSDWCGS